MGVTSVDTDLDRATMRIEADYGVSVERAWQLWADPRQLERWWGPPTYPATVTAYDLRPGGRVSYVMTGPDGDQSRGWWEVLEVDEPTLLVVEDGFADEFGEPNSDLPTMVMRTTLTERDGGVHITRVTTFASREQLEQLLQMGMKEGSLAAMSQIDDVLAT